MSSSVSGVFKRNPPRSSSRSSHSTFALLKIWIIMCEKYEKWKKQKLFPLTRDHFCSKLYCTKRQIFCTQSGKTRPDEEHFSSRCLSFRLHVLRNTCWSRLNTKKFHNIYEFRCTLFTNEGEKTQNAWIVILLRT